MLFGGDFIAEKSSLEQIDPDKISRNPANPRLIFREDEMNMLLESIREAGIQVPVTVYRDEGGYILIDGERRWRCAKKLNLAKVPAIVQPKPSPLENLLIMFNIHNVRVQWDLMPIALKLREIAALLKAQGKSTTPKSLSAITGVRLPTVRRALDLLDLPKKYQDMLLEEAEKPKGQQRITPDLFFEVYKSMHAVERYLPGVLQKDLRRAFVDSMFEKYVAGVVNNVVEYRQVSRIARAERAGVGTRVVKPVIIRLIVEQNYSIKQAYQDTVQIAYDRRELLARVEGLTEKLSRTETQKVLDRDFRRALRQLRTAVSKLLESQ